MDKKNEQILHAKVGPTVWALLSVPTINEEDESRAFFAASPLQLFESVWITLVRLSFIVRTHTRLNKWQDWNYFY